MINRKRLATLLFVLTLFLAAGHAQSAGNASQSTPAKPAASQTLVSPGQPAHKKNAGDALLSRIQFVTMDGITHFRYMDSGPGHVTARDEYYKVSTRMQINLLGDGTTYLQLRGESGRSFSSSYDYTGIGLHDRYWSYNLKSLFLGQKIGKHLEAQAGGVEFDRGAGSEATYADNDGYLEGYRLVYSEKGHKALPEKLSVTVGYIGDFLQPNFFARASRLGQENYIQVLGQKTLGENRDFSAEYTSIQAIRYAREAFHWQKFPTPVVNDFTAEAITRASDNPTFGWYSSLGRKFQAKVPVMAGVFYSDMPKGMFYSGPTQIFINGDRYAPGKRIGPTFTVTPVKNFDVMVWGGRRLDNTAGTRNRGEIAVRYQLASLFNRVLR